MLLVGDWEVHRELDRLTQLGQEVHITPKAMDVLIHLADNQGRLVTKEALLNKHWRGAISGDNAVHKTMAELRRVFGDNPKNPSYIETFPKRGYLLIADVQNTINNANPKTSNYDIHDIHDNNDNHDNQHQQQLRSPSSRQKREALYSVKTADDARPSIAAGKVIISVLPFLNLAEGEQFKFFGEGIAEEITNALGRSGIIKTLSHTASFPFGDRTSNSDEGKASENAIDPVHLGRALNVTHVLEGAIRCDSEMIRITTQLLDTSDGTQCIAKRFDHHLTLESATAHISTQEDIALPILNLLFDYFRVQTQHRLVPRNSRSPDQSYLNDIFDR
jgi:transcriptional activator of cad operon